MFISQYVADRYAPIQSPSTLYALGSKPTREPTFTSMSSHGLPASSGNVVTIEIAMTEASVIDRSIYAAHERRGNNREGQQGSSSSSYAR